jgi:recombination protein RecA
MTKKNKNHPGIKKALAALEKRYEEPVVMKMSDSNTSIETFTSGRDDLDIALGGGYAVGKLIEIFAESGAGKTGLALEAVAAIQREGGVAAIIDAEHALNTEYCEQIGVNVDELYISQPSHGEQAIEAIRALINSQEVDLIVVDSVAALTPKAILEGEAGEAKMAVLARLMSQGISMIKGVASEVGCTVMFINQLRSTMAMYGPSITTTGGKTLPFYATQRLEIKNKGRLTEGDKVIGFKQLIKIVKNKCAPPFQEIQNDIVYGKGVDTFNGLIEALVFEEIILKKGGGYFSYGETKLGQGTKKLRMTLEENPDLLEELKNKLKETKKIQKN